MGESSDQSGSGKEVKHDPYAAMRWRDYRLYLAGTVIANIGLNMQTTAVAWDLYNLTGSALSLGLVGLVQVVPVFALTLPAGHVADHHDRRRVLLTAELFLGLATLSLAMVSHFQWPVWMIYACLFCSGIGRAFQSPARQSFMPQLVPREDFSNAVTWSSAGWQISSVAGPSLAGALIALAKSTTIVYVLDFCAIMFLFYAILAIKPRPFVGKSAAMSMESLVAGTKFVWKTKIVLAAITLDLFAVLFGAAIALLPIYAKDILNVGKVGFGWMRAAPAIGALVMGLYIARRPPMKSAGKALLWAVAGFGAATIVFGFSRWYWLSLLMLMLTGVFDNISVVIRHTLVQMMTPDEMRGRVSAVNSLFIGLSNELGDFESGFAAWYFITSLGMGTERGATAAVVTGGIGTLIVVIATAAIWPEVRRFGALPGGSR